MRCVVDGCERPAVCRYCVEHRPSWLPRDLERPSVGPSAVTVDLSDDLIPGGVNESGGSGSLRVSDRDSAAVLVAESQ